MISIKQEITITVNDPSYTIYDSLLTKSNGWSRKATSKAVTYTSRKFFSPIENDRKEDDDG